MAGGVFWLRWASRAGEVTGGQWQGRGKGCLVGQWWRAAQWQAVGNKQQPDQGGCCRVL